MTKTKIAIWTGVVAAAALGLVYLNSHWIAPAAQHRDLGKAPSSYPLAPDFTLSDVNTGQPVRLADYKGKVVLVDFWATWCGPCRIEIPEFVQMQQRYRNQGFAIIGISEDDSPAPVREFYKQFNMNYPVVMGTSQVSTLYGGVIGLPTTFVIGRDGRIYAKHEGTTPAAVFEDEIQQLLAAPGNAEAAAFKPAGNSQEIDLGTPGEANPQVPGVDITALSPSQLAQFKQELQKQKCQCGGCKFNLLDCRRQDSTCPVSRKMAKEELKKFQQAAAAKAAAGPG
jgi:thiol-disulfide isomerase/thioredoxin